MELIIKKAKNEFLKMVNDFGSDPYRLLSHVPEAEKWAKKMILKYDEVDEEIVLLTVWLHDIGHYPIPTDLDHAIRSERRAKEFLQREKYSKDKLSKVLHCIRAHRCSDVLPVSLEAKIIAFVDSASHMTSPVYFEMAKDDKENSREFVVYSKIERDFRDLSSFPEMKNELIELYKAWKKIIKIYEDIDLN